MDCLYRKMKHGTISSSWCMQWTTVIAGRTSCTGKRRVRGAWGGREWLEVAPAASLLAPTANSGSGC